MTYHEWALIRAGIPNLKAVMPKSLSTKRGQDDTILISNERGNTWCIATHPVHGISITPVGASLIPYCLEIAERRDLCDKWLAAAKSAPDINGHKDDPTQAGHIWLLADGRSLKLLTPDQLPHLPYGTRLLSILGEYKTYGVDHIDQDTRNGYLAWGLVPD